MWRMAQYKAILCVIMCTDEKIAVVWSGLADCLWHEGAVGRGVH